VKPLFIIAALFLLSGCSSSGTSTPAPNPVPQPPVSQTLAMPARRVFKGDWSKPSIGLTGTFEGDPPPIVSAPPGTIWVTFPRPGLQGQACLDPAPNPGYHTDSGNLVFTPGPIGSGSPGFPVQTLRTFSLNYHLAISCDVMFEDIGSFAAYAGPVIYHGETQGQYRAAYGQNFTRQDIDLSVDASVTGYTAPIKIPTGQWVSMEVHYYPDGTWRFAYQGQEFIPTGITDPGLLTGDPHCGLFCGGFNSFRVGRFEVWSDDPSETEI